MSVPYTLLWSSVCSWYVHERLLCTHSGPAAASNPTTDPANLGKCLCQFSLHTILPGASNYRCSLQQQPLCLKYHDILSYQSLLRSTTKIIQSRQERQRNPSENLSSSSSSNSSSPYPRSSNTCGSVRRRFAGVVWHCLVHKRIGRRISSEDYLSRQ